MSIIQSTVLDNGIRVISDDVSSVGSVALGIWVAVGTRHEDLTHNGVAHMVEHMMFKGTPLRNAKQIAEQVENVGGQMNAYTSREVTSYYMHVLKDDARLGLEILSDILQRPTMPEDEIERERHVILQEIGMTEDTPDDIIFDEYQELAFPNQGLGAPILGRREIIEAMQRAPLMDYVERFYTGNRIIVSAAGNINHEELVAMVHELLGDLPRGEDLKLSPGQYQGGYLAHDKELEQAHVILGFEGVSRMDEKEYYTAQALSTILGGGMSSRLFQEIREKRGLVYSVYSFQQGYRDTGHFGIYAGTGPDDLPEMVPVMCEELVRLADSLTEEEVARARAQLKASLMMGRESMMNRADHQAKHMIYRDKVLVPSALSDKLQNLSADDIAALARKIFSTTPTLIGLGPLTQLEPYEQVQGRLAA